MRLLPPLVAERAQWVLPMADRSAAALAAALLADAPRRAAAVLGEALSGDPPLTVWVVAMASLVERWRPQSLAEAAGWLSQHALRLLRWEPERDRFDPGPGQPDIGEVVGLVRMSLAVAELAALRAQQRGPEAAEQARLAGLVHQAPRWFALAARGRRDRLLPEALAAVAAPSHPAVIEAAQWLADAGGLESCGLDLQACGQCADRRQREWAEAEPGAADLLPPLVRRLARLAEWEGRFEEAVARGKLEAMAEFAAGAGHEINNPLAIIAGRAQLLVRDETDAERRRELALINAQVKRAYEMIADMRLFARPPRPEPKSIDLVALVDRLVAELAPQAAERATTLARSGHPGPLEIEADPAQLSVAIHALCRNALEAIGHGGRIEIVLDGGPSAVRIRVSDTGPGIPPEHLPHLFDPFFSARQAGRGLGLGLSKCWRIVTGHGGRIDVETQLAQGTTFTIELPRSR